MGNATSSLDTNKGAYNLWARYFGITRQVSFYLGQGTDALMLWGRAGNLRWTRIPSGGLWRNTLRTISQSQIQTLSPHIVLYMNTVKSPHTSHLGDRGEWLLLRDQGSQ